MQIGLQRAQRLVTIATSLQLYSCSLFAVRTETVGSLCKHRTELSAIAWLLC